MRTALLVAAALAASVNGAVIEGRQRPRPTSRPSNPGGSIPDVSACGLDAFVGHTSEALLFCSSILKSGTATLTSTYTSRETTTTITTVYTTLYPITSSAVPSSTPKPPPPPSSTPKPPPPPSSTPKPPPPPSSTPKPPSSTPTPTPSSSSPTPVQPSSSPAPTVTPSCGIVGYTGSTAAYYFDSSGTKNTFSACKAACTADAKCKSFGYGEANCLLFDVTAAGNTNYNPMSPYTFYDAACPVELPVKHKRQVNISLGLGTPGQISSACSCLITSGPADATKTTTVTVTSVRVTRTETTTRTVSLLPGKRM